MSPRDVEFLILVLAIAVFTGAACAMGVLLWRTLCAGVAALLNECEAERLDLAHDARHCTRELR